MSLPTTLAAGSLDYRLTCSFEQVLVSLLLDVMYELGGHWDRRLIRHGRKVPSMSVPAMQRVFDQWLVDLRWPADRISGPRAGDNQPHPAVWDLSPARRLLTGRAAWVDGSWGVQRFGLGRTDLPGSGLLPTNETAEVGPNRLRVVQRRHAASLIACQRLKIPTLRDPQPHPILLTIRVARVMERNSKRYAHTLVEFGASEFTRVRDARSVFGFSLCYPTLLTLDGRMALPLFMGYEGPLLARLLVWLDTLDRPEPEYTYVLTPRHPDQMRMQWSRTVVSGDYDNVHDAVTQIDSYVTGRQVPPWFAVVPVVGTGGTKETFELPRDLMTSEEFWPGFWAMSRTEQGVRQYYELVGTRLKRWFLVRHGVEVQPVSTREQSMLFGLPAEYEKQVQCEMNVPARSYGQEAY